MDLGWEIRRIHDGKKTKEIKPESGGGSDI